MQAMTISPGFDLTDALTPSAAASALREALKGEALSGEVIYRAFRSWTWRALTERRYDRELRAWLDLMRRTMAVLRKREPAAALKLSALGDLVVESIQFGEHDSVADILQRVHVRQMLLLLKAGVQKRAVLARRLRLKDANLSRVLSLLLSAGLIERTAAGKEALFRLTRRGEDLAAQLPAPVAKPSIPVAVRVDSAASAGGRVRQDNAPAIMWVSGTAAKSARVEGGMIVINGKAYRRSPPRKACAALRDPARKAVREGGVGGLAASAASDKLHLDHFTFTLVGADRKPPVLEKEPLKASEPRIVMGRSALQPRTSKWGEEFQEQRLEHV